LDVAAKDAAVGAEALDEPDAIAHEAGALDLPLGLVDAVGGPTSEVQEGEICVVPRALGRLVRADRHGALAVPTDLEAGDAFRPDLLSRAALDLDDVQPAPGL